MKVRSEWLNVLCVLLTLFVVTASAASAQQAPRTWLADVVPVTMSSAGQHPAAALPAVSLPDLERRQEYRTRRWEGAAIGFVVGAVATHVLLRQGGSTSLCNRDENQDAINARECAGLAVLGGVAGGVAGYLIGGRIRRGP